MPIVQLGVIFVEIESKAVNKKRNTSSDIMRRDNSKKARKFKGNCYYSGKVGHRSSECRKSKRNAQANMVERGMLSDGMLEMIYLQLFSSAITLKN